MASSELLLNSEECLIEKFRNWISEKSLSSFEVINGHEILNCFLRERFNGSKIMSLSEYRRISSENRALIKVIKDWTTAFTIDNQEYRGLFKNFLISTFFPFKSPSRKTLKNAIIAFQKDVIQKTYIVDQLSTPAEALGEIFDEVRLELSEKAERISTRTTPTPNNSHTILPETITQLNLDDSKKANLSAELLQKHSLLNSDTILKKKKSKAISKTSENKSFAGAAPKQYNENFIANFDSKLEKGIKNDSELEKDGEEFRFQKEKSQQKKEGEKKSKLTRIQERDLRNENAIKNKLNRPELIKTKDIEKSKSRLERIEDKNKGRELIRLRKSQNTDSEKKSSEIKTNLKNNLKEVAQNEEQTNPYYLGGDTNEGTNSSLDQTLEGKLPIKSSNKRHETKIPDEEILRAFDQINEEKKRKIDILLSKIELSSEELKKEIARLNIQAQRKRYKIKRKKNDVTFKILNRLRTRMLLVLKGQKKAGTSLNLLGCSPEELKSHLEAKFKEGMTWDNYGINGWHIDHIKPCALFDLSLPEEQKQCFHFTNLQPLWWDENLKKSDNYSEDTQ
jgi:hypothetical protein